MKNLQLSLKTNWFEMTKSGEKTEDYRDITPYWANRLLYFDKKERRKQWWINEFFDIGTNEEIAENLELFCQKIVFDANTMTLGYPKKTDSERILRLEHKGIEIREGNPNWGAKKGVLYFVIKHGNVLKSVG